MGSRVSLYVGARTGKRVEVRRRERQIVGATERTCEPGEVLFFDSVHAKQTPVRRSVFSSGVGNAMRDYVWARTQRRIAAWAATSSSL